jgi:hypothetical protein
MTESGPVHDHCRPDAQREHELLPEGSDDSDDYVEEGPIRVYHPDRRHYTGDIHEDNVESRTAIPLAQLNNSPSNRLCFINQEHVTLLQAHTAHNINARKTLRQDTKHLQDAIIKYGYRDTRNSNLWCVLALPQLWKCPLHPLAIFWSQRTKFSVDITVLQP